jgi:hypothetical protein
MKDKTFAELLAEMSPDLRNLPGTPIACEAVQESRLFDRTFDALLA